MSKNSTLERIRENPEIYPRENEWAHYFIVYLAEDFAGFDELVPAVIEVAADKLESARVEVTGKGMYIYAGEVLPDATVSSVVTAVSALPGVIGVQPDTRDKRRDQFTFNAMC